MHNKKLDDLLLLFQETDEEKANIKESLNELYENWGTYGASAIIQTQIDVNMFLAFLDGNAEILKRFPHGEYRYEDATKNEYDVEYGEEFMNPIKKIKNNVVEWLEPNYSKVFAPVFNSFDHKPAAEEFITALDNYVKKNEYKLFKGIYYNDYSNPSRSFKDKQANNNLSIIQNNSDLIAYKIHRANLMLFANLLEANGIKNDELYIIFYSGFMNAVSPVHR